MSERPYTVRPYEPGDEHGILALFNHVFGEDDPAFKPRTLEQWRWLYERNPAGRQIVVAVEDGGRIVAHYACLPARARISHHGDEVVIAGQGVDSMVHADYRRGLRKEGAFLQTARGYFERFGRWPVCGFGYGFPNRKAYPVGVRLIGYQPVVRPLPTLYRNFFEDPDPGSIGREHADAADVVEVESFAPASDEIDALWDRLRPKYPFALVRDSTYLRWRYDECPWLAHRKFLVRERGAGPLRALFVTRSDWQRLPIQALVDWLGDPDDAAAIALALRTTAQLGKEAGQARIEAWLPPESQPFAHALAAGFKTEPCQYVLCVMLYREQPDLEWVKPRWYWTIGDSDVH